MPVQKKLYLGTNTKMYKTIADTLHYLKELGRYTEDIDREWMELFVIPSFTSLESARVVAKETGISLGAQNMGWEDEGQFTGEISPLMLKEVGVKVVEIGHSERRHVLHETDEMENQKVCAALQHGFTALLCVGETKEQKDYGISAEVLRTQLKVGLFSAKPERPEQLWIAYEPVWAIGVNGVPADASYVREIHAMIRETLCALYGQDMGERIPILYGGSVNTENAVPFIGLDNVDGLFIGRSAWDAKNFNKIIRDVLSETAKNRL